MSEQSDEIEFRVRYAETDGMGVVHHSRYAVYFEMGRTELMRSQGACYRDLEASGVFFVITKMAVRFKAPARYDDLLVLTTTCERITGVRVDHSYRLCRKGDGVLIAEGQTTLGSVDAAGRVARLPESVRRLL